MIVAIVLLDPAAVVMVLIGAAITRVATIEAARAAMMNFFMGFLRFTPSLALIGNWAARVASVSSEAGFVSAGAPRPSSGAHARYQSSGPSSPGNRKTP